MVFQSFNLFPHMTVLDNVTLGPTKVLKQPKACRSEGDHGQDAGGVAQGAVEAQLA